MAPDISHCGKSFIYMKKCKGSHTGSWETPAFKTSNWKTDLLWQHFGIYHEEMAQLDQEDYHLFNYSLV